MTWLDVDVREKMKSSWGVAFSRFFPMRTETKTGNAAANARL
jgi:hypothetical protein